MVTQNLNTINGLWLFTIGGGNVNLEEEEEENEDEWEGFPDPTDWGEDEEE